MSESTSDLMTLAEVAAYTRVPESTLRYYRLVGKGPRSGRVGKRVMYRRGDVEQWLGDEMAATAATP